MNELTEMFIKLIKHMDEMATGEMEFSIEFPGKKKRSIKIIVDENEP